MFLLRHKYKTEDRDEIANLKSNENFNMNFYLQDVRMQNGKYTNVILWYLCRASINESELFKLERLAQNFVCENNIVGFSVFKRGNLNVVTYLVSICHLTSSITLS